MVGKVSQSSAYRNAVAADGPGARIVRAGSRASVASWARLAACLALWASGLGAVDVARVETAGLGLVSVLPITFWLALAGLLASFGWSVTRRHTRWPILAAHVIALIAVLHCTPAIVYGTLRYSWAWKHAGVVDYIAHNGIHFNLGGELGANQGWPGFFALNTFLTSAAGLQTTLGYEQWVLPVNDLLWLGPVILIARAFTCDQRLIWTAAWLFELGNWVGQDYFSPQAFAFFLYLTVIAVCLRWLWHPRIGPPPAMTGLPKTPVRSTPRRWVLVLCLLPLMAAIASAHQLTPLMLVGALTLLVAFRQLRPRTLPLLMAVITVGWILYGGLPWLAANTTSFVFSGVGDPWANISMHIVGQSQGMGQVPTGQIVAAWGCRAASAAMGVLALIGFWRYRRHNDAQARRSWNRLTVLAVAAIPAAAANSYGGEIIFRVYLFALPFLAIAAAAAFFPSSRAGWSASGGVMLTITALALGAGFSLGNYGQEAINYYNPQEVAASEWLYRTAPPGAMVMSADTNFPRDFVHYNWYYVAFLDSPLSFSRSVVRAPVKTITRAMSNGPPAKAITRAWGKGPSYLILTRSQAAAMRLNGAWPPGAYERINHALLASGKFTVVYSNDDAEILRLTPRAANRER